MWGLAAELWAADHPVTVPFGDVTIDVPPMWQWPETALLALLAEDHETWAVLALTDANHELWRCVDPDLDACDEFEQAWEQATCQRLDDIARMWHILDRHRDPLESDLVRYYRQDLRDLWAPGHGASRLTWRRLAALYDGLPGESAVKTAQTNAIGEAELARLAKQGRDGFGAWSHTDLLIADLIDAVNHNTYVLRLANTDPKHKRSVKPPEPVHRPGLVSKRRPRVSTPSPQRARLLAYMRANGGALPEGWVNQTD